MTGLRQLRDSAAGCTGCQLYERATRTVFGDGNASATIVIVGEQPDDEDDKAGRPFCGRAGRVLDRALARSGISRPDIYLTNAVKHFKWQEHGGRRVHQRPGGGEIRACRPWLEAELEAIGPRVVVLLGAVAGESLFGPHFRVGEYKGTPRAAAAGGWRGLAVGTIHPSAVLRGPDTDSQDRAYAGLVADLVAAREAADLAPAAGEHGQRAVRRAAARRSALR